MHPQYPLLSLLAGSLPSPRTDKPELAELMVTAHALIVIVDGSGIGRNLKCFAAVVDEIIGLQQPMRCPLLMPKTATLLARRPIARHF